MHPLWRVPYAVAGALASAATALPLGEGKRGRALGARRGLRSRVERWADAHRDPARPLLWMHAPSVGEGLQARPVLERLRAAHPDWQLVYTHFSPSAEAFARTLPVDAADYLPLDTAANAAWMLDALRPTALVFSKLDVWPLLAEQAAARGVAVGMISATVAPSSGRLRPLARSLTADAFGALRRVGAIAEDDAARLTRLGVPRERVEVTGDTRYDQVWARAQAARLDGALLAPLRAPRPTLVAGSTWPADEGPLLEAWTRVRDEVPQARLIIAPHEPTAMHLGPIERWAGRRRVPVARLGAGASELRSADLILVDRVGVLGELYAMADLAYVGGGFHAAGLHSVLEPAAYGAPVLFGPRWQGSRDAGLLRAGGGGYDVADADTLGDYLVALLGDREARRAAGDAARAVVRAGLGAADRSAQLVERLMAGA